MIKVPIMLTALEMVQERKLSTDSMIELPASTILEDTEVFEYGAGKYTIEELLVWMIINSDNTATNCLIDFITMDRINDFCQRMNLPCTKLERRMLDFKAVENGQNNYTSAGDMKALFKALYDQSILTPKLCDYAISILKRQRCKQNSMRYIKDEVIVAYKTGGLDFLNHDAGIFYLKNASYFFGAFVTESPDDDYGRRWIGRVSKLVYDYFSKTVIE
jgi:beta-lactamase class A